MKNSWYLEEEVHQFLSESLARWLAKECTYEDISHLLLDKFGISKSSESIRKVNKKYFEGNDNLETYQEEQKEKDWKEEEKEIDESHILSFKNYVYNKNEDIYSVNTDKGFISIPGRQLRRMKEAYSADSGNFKTINQCCREFGLRRATFMAIIKALGWTHDSTAHLDEAFDEHSPEELAELTLSRKHRDYELHLREKDHEWYKREWEKLAKEEISREEFANTYSDAIESFEYKPLVNQFKSRRIEADNAHTLVVSAADFHIGFYQRAAESIIGRRYDLDIIRDFTEKYVEGIYEFVDNYKIRIDKVIILDGGDNFEGLRGYTDKGTPRQTIGTPKHIWHSGFQMMFNMVDSLRGLAPQTEYQHVVGNHDSMADYMLPYTLNQAYREYDDVQINVNDSSIMTTTIGNSQIFMRHGRRISDKITGAHENKMKTDIILKGDGKSLFYYFFVSDKHQMQESELAGFTFIRMPSSLGSDLFGESIHVHSRQSGRIHIFSHEDGLRTSHNIFYPEKGD